MRSGYFDKHGNPIDLMTFADLFSDVNNYKIINRTDLEHVWVSTVWMGLDMDFYEQREKPLLFETMVFPHGSWGDVDMDQYCTEEEAIKGHDMMVEKWKGRKPGILEE